jgi:hypothetical protein
MRSFLLQIQLSVTALLLVGCVSISNKEADLVRVKVASIVDKKNTSEVITGFVDSSEVKSKICFKPYHGKETHWLGTDGGIPELIVHSLMVSRDGRSFNIPKSLYDDFSDFSIYKGSLELHDTKMGFSLSYHGSDGAGAYGASFFFDEEKLYKMTIGHLGMGERNNMVTWVTSQRYPMQNKAAHTNPLPAPSRSLNENYEP